MHSETAQLEHVVPNTTKLVTFTVGGNDVGFEKVLSACIAGPLAKGKVGCRNDGALSKTVNDNLAALPDGISIVQNRAKDSLLIRKSLADLYVDVATRLAPSGRRASALTCWRTGSRSTCSSFSTSS